MLAAQSRWVLERCHDTGGSGFPEHLLSRENQRGCGRARPHRPSLGNADP